MVHFSVFLVFDNLIEKFFRQIEPAAAITPITAIGCVSTGGRGQGVDKGGQRFGRITVIVADSRVGLVLDMICPRPRSAEVYAGASLS